MLSPTESKSGIEVGIPIAIPVPIQGMAHPYLPGRCGSLNVNRPWSALPGSAPNPTGPIRPWACPRIRHSAADSGITRPRVRRPPSPSTTTGWRQKRALPRSGATGWDRERVKSRQIIGFFEQIWLFFW